MMPTSLEAASKEVVWLIVGSRVIMLGRVLVISVRAFNFNKIKKICRGI